jgi:hypothetical protein
MKKQERIGLLRSGPHTKERHPKQPNSVVDPVIEKEFRNAQVRKIRNLSLKEWKEVREAMDLL